MQTEPEQWAEELFDAIYSDMASYAEWGIPSYREASLQTINEAFARHRQQAERAFEERESKLREALRKIQDEGDARANAIATQALKETPNAQ